MGFRQKLSASKLRIKRKIRSGVGWNIDAVTKLETFYPASDNFWLYPDIAFSAADEFPTQLLQLMSVDGVKVRPSKSSEIIEANDLIGSSSEFADQLAFIFEKHGSDKKRTGNYQLYSHILGDLNTDRPNILEIGIGTNSPNLISTMGTSGIPGSSLRAFSNFFPKANVFGADIDENILFSEGKIQTAFVDQLDQESLGSLSSRLGQPSFDLVIDDGLHATNANLNTLFSFMSRMERGTWICIEDIPERSLSVWQVVQNIIGDTQYSSSIVRCSNSSFAFILKFQAKHIFVK